MQYIKQEIQKGNVQLAKFDNNNQPIPMDYSELEQKKKVQDKRAQILTKLSTLDPDEKKQWVYLKKLRANQFFKANKLQQALELYVEALLGLDLKHDDRQKLKQQNNDLKYPILLNMATCFYKQKQYAKTIELCNKILAEEDGKVCIKAYYKKAYALFACHQYQEAKKEALQGLKCIKSEARQTNIKKSDFTTLLIEIDKKSSNEKSMYQKMFKDQQDSDQQTIANGTQKKQDVLIYKDSWWDKLTGLCTRSAQATRSVLGSKPKQKNI